VLSRAGHAAVACVPSGGSIGALCARERIARWLGGMCTAAVVGTSRDGCRRLVVEWLGLGIAVASSSA
jgi:hypothetical protein